MVEAAEFVIPMSKRRQWLPVVFAVGGFVAAGMAISEGRSAEYALPLALAFAAVNAIWCLVRVLYDPTRIVFSDAGVTFHAIKRQETVPWRELVGVTLTRIGPGRALVWVCADRDDILTSGDIDKVHRLLSLVERHAPHAAVMS